ncbi:f5 8 type c domain protein [Chrysochromulina tobinii]|uniref:F5 8 type c domain protein n=1 Tax=Chrysochromulina tobinii TaxID=1460289 RepID=A0A0M0JNF7_9EUKA|nr:f5 8 type c domain protein [Chrysochromulina tobinii]|eukprot:KOO28114.1 f5 8 type c domain protein [Chrysochromulina sp. CCMP291]
MVDVRVCLLSPIALVSSLQSPLVIEDHSARALLQPQLLQPPVEGVSANLPVRIALASDATPSEQLAAKELQSFLSKLCPFRAFDIGAPEPGGTQQLAVGRGAALALGAPADALQQAGETTLLDTTLLAASGSTIVSGGPDRGALYAAYQLLEHLGYRFLAPDETIVPAECPSQLPAFVRRESSPHFEYRDNNQIAILLSPAWATRVGYNGDTSNQSAALGSHVGYANPPGFVHTAYNLVAQRSRAEAEEANQNAHPGAAFHEHPDWFYPPYAGANGQLCWSSTALVDFLIERVREELRAQPERRILSVSQMDNGNYCQSRAEQELARKHGAQIAPMLLAVNRIADAIRDEFPQVALDTLAYQWSRSPPTSELKPRPNKTQRIYVWDYTTDFDGYFVPYANVHTLVPNLRTYHEHGVKGVFEEGNYNSKGGDLVQLKDYLLAKALWNSSLDAEGTIREFTDGYYGAIGGAAVRRYISLMEHGVTEEESMPYAFPGELAGGPAQFLKPSLLLAAANAFADAISASTAAYGREHKYVQRLEEASMPLQYVALFRWAELRAAHLLAEAHQQLQPPNGGPEGGVVSSSADELSETAIELSETAIELAGRRWPYRNEQRAQYAEFQRIYTQVLSANCS